MNLTDLSAELEARAAAVQPSAGLARLAAVRGRARVRRRRQAGAVALIAAGCALAIAVVPNLVGLHIDRSAPPTRGAHPLKPFTFDDVDAGDPLVAHAMGAAGQNEVELRFTPTDTNLSLHDFCYVPKSDGVLAGKVSVNGHEAIGSTCSEEKLTGSSSSFGDNAAETRAGWADLGVIPGRESVLRIRLQTFKSGKLLTDPSVRLGIGIYELSGDRITSDGQVIKQDAEADGHNYRLAGYRTVPITRQHRTVTLAVPAGRAPAFVLAGSPGASAESDKGNMELTISGGGIPEGGSSGIVMTTTLDDAKTHTLNLGVDAATGNAGILVLAYYLRTD